MPFDIDIHHLIDDLRIISWEAADTLIFYSEIIKKNNIEMVDIKAGNEPVTVADLTVNNSIVKKLKEKYSKYGWNIITEESGEIGISNLKKQSDFTWVLDPLDGTKDYIQGTGEYAMHLALNYKGRPFLGVVLIPEKNELWISDGTRCWCEGRDRLKKKVNPVEKDFLNEMTIVTSKNHNNKLLIEFIEKLGFKNKISMGSIGCKVASLLRGESDIYISLSIPKQSCPKDWDFAAPEAILKSGGGSITNINNQNLIYLKNNYEQSGIIIASRNKKKHKDICQRIKSIYEENNFPSLQDLI